MSKFRTYQLNCSFKQNKQAETYEHQEHKQSRSAHEEFRDGHTSATQDALGATKNETRFFTFGSHTHTLTRSLSRALALSHSSFSHSRTLAQTRTHFHTFSHTFTYSHTLSHALTRSHKRSPTLSHILTLFQKRNLGRRRAQEQRTGQVQACWWHPSKNRRPSTGRQGGDMLSRAWLLSSVAQARGHFFFQHTCVGTA